VLRTTAANYSTPTAPQ